MDFQRTLHCWKNHAALSFPQRGETVKALTPKAHGPVAGRVGGWSGLVREVPPAERSPDRWVWRKGRGPDLEGVNLRMRPVS